MRSNLSGRSSSRLKGWSVVAGPPSCLLPPSFAGAQLLSSWSLGGRRRPCRVGAVLLSCRCCNRQRRHPSGDFVLSLTTLSSERTLESGISTSRRQRERGEVAWLVLPVLLHIGVVVERGIRSNRVRTPGPPGRRSRCGCSF